MPRGVAFFGHWPRSWRLWVFWTAALSVVVLSLMPTHNLPSAVMDVWDKAQHALGFAGLALLGGLAYGKRLWRLAVGLLLLGALIELAQAATGWRQGDVLDWLADAVGVLVGLLVFWGLWPKVRAQTGSASSGRPSTNTFNSPG